VITYPHNLRFAAASGREGRLILAGQRLVVTEVNAREFRARRDALGCFQSQPLDGELRAYRYPTDLTGKSLLLIRPGGLGDLLFLTPTLRFLKQRWPSARLAVAAFPDLLKILEGNPHLDELLPYPVAYESFRRFDYHADFEGVIEDSRRAEQVTAVQAVAEWVGIELATPEERLTELHLTDDDRWSVRYLTKKKPGERWVGLQPQASSAIRSYPLQQSAQVALSLAEAGMRVFILGSSGQWGRWRKIEERTWGRGSSPALVTYLPSPPNIVDLTGRFNNIRKLAAFIEALDLLICPDSSMAHIAGALNLPTIALYGPFPAKLRIGDYPRAVALQGQADCAPCFHHGYALPCGRRHCSALEAIQPDHIVAVAREMLNV